MVIDESYTLKNGVNIPKLGLGTWLISDDKVALAVEQAISIGYRHIDTAQAYGNEHGVGAGVKAGGISRDKIFVTDKIAAENKTYASAMASIDESLMKTGLEYMDMMIIHSPQPWKEVNQSENRYFEENRQVWKALEDALRSGKVRAIGVSNFTKEDIENLWETAEIKPMVNQVLCHISNTPKELIDYCWSKDILMEAYSPVAHGEALKNNLIRKMADKYGVSVPQLCIRYDLQLGMAVIPKSVSAEHMKLNSQLDFTVSDDDMNELLNIDKIKDYGEYSHFPVFGGKK